MRREFRAFLGHYYTLCGIEILARVRIRQFIGALREARNDQIAAEEQLDAIRARILTEHMKSAPKTLMAWDVPKEIDVYAWGPLELFFCSAQAMIDKYHALKASHPEVGFPSLDSYISDNKPVFDAVEGLRDWVTHPGYSRNAHEALAEISQIYREQNLGHFYEVVRRLLDLYRQLLERLEDHIGKE